MYTRKPSKTVINSQAHGEVQFYKFYIYTKLRIFAFKYHGVTKRSHAKYPMYCVYIIIYSCEIHLVAKKCNMLVGLFVENN